MPVKMVSLGPNFVGGSCPTCSHALNVGFYENQNVVRFSCDWCGQWITAELRNEQLAVSTKDADYAPIRKDETCPNPKCGAAWELWYHPNGAVDKLHGAVFIASGNNVKCTKCGTRAIVSLN